MSAEYELPVTTAKSSVHDIVESLCAENEIFGRTERHSCERNLPSRNIVVEIVELLRTAFFPGYYGLSDLSRESLSYHIGTTIDTVRRLLVEQVKRGLCFTCDRDRNCSECEQWATETTAAFLKRLPLIKELLAGDVDAAYQGDPAAHSYDEIIFCYPGLSAIMNYRIAHELYQLDVPLLPRIITEHAHSSTGIDIHPGASIGTHFFIDHGTGIVIGETSVIGKNVRIYQGVTLGAKSFPLDEHGRPIKGIKRHPNVEDDVVIYSGATILGPITIGTGSVIGGNVWVIHDVPAGSKVTQAKPTEEHFDFGAGI